MERTKGFPPEKNEWGLPDIGIPAEVLFHPELTLTEKVLFGFIRNLSRSKRGCWASNRWLGGCMNLKGDTISRAIANLKQWKVINIEYLKTPDGREVRQIFINLEYPKIFYKQMMTNEGYHEINRGVLLKSYPPIISVPSPSDKKPTKEDKEKDSKKDKEKDQMIRSSPRLIPLKSHGKITPLLFDEFWTLYPKKTDKGKAKTLWGKICNKPVATRPSWEEIETAITEQSKTKRWMRGFIPMPTTWLNNQRWLDDPEEMNEGDWDAEPLQPPPKSHREVIKKYFNSKDSESIFIKECYQPAKSMMDTTNGEINKGELAEVLVRLHGQIKDEQSKIASKELFNLLPGALTLTSYYIEWVEDQDWIDHRSLDMFNVRHSLFTKFRRDEAKKDNLERDPLSGKSYNRG